MALDDWDNKEALSFRTRLALRILMLAFKIISPYRFATTFKDDFEQIDKLLKEAA